MIKKYIENANFEECSSLSPNEVYKAIFFVRISVHIS